MVTLRRRPRLQRQCNVAKVKEQAAVESTGKTPRKADKENRAPNKSPGPTNTPKPAKKQRTQGKDQDLAKKVKQESKSKALEVSSRRSKRSRLDKTVDSEEVTKVTPDGLVYEVGRRKSSSGPGPDEFVLRLNNSSNAKSKKQNKSVNLDPDVPMKSPKKESKAPKIKSPKSPPVSKRKDSKSPLRLSLKPEPRSPNQIFKIPRSSCSRKQRVSVEVAAEVQSQEQSLSVCSMILSKKKRKSSEDGVASALEDKVPRKTGDVKSQYPLFAGISPIVASKKEIEKLETLEKSMNLFECPMSPIGNPDQKNSLNYSNLALKPEIKSLPKRPKTRPVKKPDTKKSKTVTKKHGTKSKKNADSSLLKTPLRQTFRAKPNSEPELEEQNSSLLFGDDSEDSAGEEGFTLYPLSDKSSWEPKPKPVVNKSKKNDNVGEMDYNQWLENHQDDYNQYKDLELCVE